jgi:hypothetical protein
LTTAKLSPDSGKVYIDQNAARNPHSPLEPLFRALYVQRPDFEIDDVDLVSDRNNIRKLLRFVNASSSEPFRIRVEIAGSKTVLFTRVEDKNTEVIQGFRGFGHRFEKAYTNSLDGSTGHHRIVNYRFGNLKCVVRHETDGYIGYKAGLATMTESEQTADSLLNQLGRLSISGSQATPSSSSGISIESGGKDVDLSSTLEIKTRAASRQLDMIEVLPQLWISQTPHLVIGYHQKGVFNDVKLRDMKREIRDWEVANRKTLQSLEHLLKRIIDAARSSPTRKAVVTYNGGMTLNILPGHQNSALPNDLYSKWGLVKQKEEQVSARHHTACRESEGVAGEEDKADTRREATEVKESDIQGSAGKKDGAEDKSKDNTSRTGTTAND